MSAKYPIVRLLLVEDDPDDQWLLQDLLSRIGDSETYSVELATNYEAALLALARHEHDIGIVDYLLGGNTGIDLLNATAGDPNRPPLIFLTGHGSAEIDRSALAAGAADFLVKASLDGPRLERSLRYVLAQHRLSQRLLERERNFSAIFDASPVPLWVYDDESLEILEANQAALELYGYGRTEFLKLKITDLRAESEVPNLVRYLQEHRHTPDTLRAGVWQHRRKDGSQIAVEIVRAQIHIGGQRQRLIAATDVSVRMRAESVLRESEAALRQVLRDVGDGLMVTDTQDIVCVANPALCVLLGQSETELIGRPAPEELTGSTGSRIELVDSLGAVHEFDRRTSETFWKGQAARVLTLRDVTEQHASERKLRLLQRAVESTKDGIVIVDLGAPDQPITYVNAAFERMTGYASQDVIGRNCRFLQAEDRLQPEIEIMNRAIAERENCEVVLRNYRKDGSLFWNRLLLSPVPDESGTVTHYIGVQTDITAQTVMEAEHTYLASHDPLTRLPRFVGSEERIEALLQQARERQRRLVVVFVDIDRFNSVNDTMGFAMGDAALRLVADRLRAASGPDCEVMRYAGEEFLIAIGDVDPAADLLQLATRYCECIAEPMPISQLATLYLTASAGVAAFPDSGQSVLELTRQADIATKRAKRNGRNGEYVFNSELTEALNDRLALGGHMRKALACDEFLLYYQPQVDAQDGSVVGLEALVRWDSPEFGFLLPSRFIPVAEDNGMILELGAWVLRTACRHLRTWIDSGLSGFKVSVNMSAAQMQRPSFVADVNRIFNETGVNPAMLQLELTESVLMDNAERSAKQMQQLKKTGVHIALDDFGVGYSSLSYLRGFPIDSLKIDQSVIANITRDGKGAALVRAMISIGHHLGMRVVAEGVETAAQASYLRRSHCDELQGFYFSQALPASSVPELLRQRYQTQDEGAQAEPRRTLLVLDDEENILRALTRVFRRENYQVLAASTANQAFDLLATHAVQVVMSDQRMPGMSGTEFLSQVKALYPDTMRIVLSGYTDLASVTDAINRGAIYKFLTKPWDDDVLCAQVQEAFQQFEQGADAKQ